MNKLKTIIFTLLLTNLGLVLSPSIFSKNYSDKMQIAKQNEMKKDQHYINAVDSYIRNLNEKNLEGILNLFADNATVEDPVGSNIVKGNDALRQFYAGAVTIDLLLTRTGPVRIAGVEVAFPFQLQMEVEDTTMITDIIDVFRFDEEGKIVSMRAFWGESNRRVASE